MSNSTDVIDLLNKARNINPGVANLPKFDERLEAVFRSQDPHTMLKEQVGILRIGTDIQADIAQTMSGINADKLVALATRKAWWGRVPIINGYQKPGEVDATKQALEHAKTDLTALEQFIDKVVRMIKPKYDLLQQDALIAAIVIPDDVQRIVMLQSAVQSTQILLVTLANCILSARRDLLSIEQLLAVTIPTWTLARAQKQLLTASKRQRIMHISTSSVKEILHYDAS